MAAAGDRFANMKEEELLNILESRDNKNTSNVIWASVIVSKEYTEKRGDVQFDEIVTINYEQINNFLRKF